jgi:type VI protein secretion system component VasK
VESRLREYGGLNARGTAFCGQLQGLLLNKYPFNPRAAAEATPQDLQAVLGKPGGALWQFYEANLRDNLIRQGEQYLPAPASSTAFTPKFLRSFNALAHLSDVLYSGNSPEPRLNYTLRVLPSQQLQNVTLMVDGQKVSSSGSPTPLFWPGKGVQSVKSSVLGLEWANHEGVWAIFRFLGSAKTWTPSGATSILEWDIVIGGQRAATLRMELGGPPEIVQRGYLARLGCVAEIVR